MYSSTSENYFFLTQCFVAGPHQLKKKIRMFTGIWTRELFLGHSNYFAFAINEK